MRHLPWALLLLITAACSAPVSSTASPAAMPTQLVRGPIAHATHEPALTSTPMLLLTATPTSKPSATMTETSTPSRSETATPTAAPSATRKPTLAVTQQPEPASTQPPIPTSAAPVSVSHVGTGQFDGCPFLFEEKYMTQPPSGGSSMELVNWALGKQIMHLQSISRNENGEVLAFLESGETVNLNAVDHRVVTLLNVPLAIGTREDGITWKEVSPDILYEILIPGVPLYYGNPGWGLTFKVVVGCNQP